MIIKNVDDMGISNVYVTPHSKQIKSLFRENLGKWDWNNSNIHKAVTGLGVAGTLGYNRKDKPSFKKGGVMFNKNMISIEVADNKFKQEQGLQHRKAVPMLFPNINGPMHMKNVENISFLFIKNGKVLDIQKGISNSNDLHYNKEAEHVLEVPKGFVERNKIVVGNPIQMKFQKGGKIPKFQNAGFFDTISDTFKKVFTLNGMDASKVSAQPSFGQAFKMAKSMGLGKFTYKDKRYNTNEKESPVILKATKESAPSSYKQRGYLTDYLNDPASRKKLINRGYTTEEINQGLNNMATVETNITDSDTYSNDENYSKGSYLKRNQKPSEYIKSIIDNSTSTNLDNEKFKVDKIMGVLVAGTAEAFYYPKTNKIYSSTKNASTLVHELGHSTKLDDKGIGEIGKESYSNEEIFPRVLELKYLLNVKPTEKIDFNNPEIKNRIIKSGWLDNPYNEKIFKHKDFFHTFNEVVSNQKLKKVPYVQKGGVIPATMNVIPRGVAHARKNSIHPKHNLGPKGIPVINQNKEKEAEIESMELTLNKNLTDKLHDIYNKWKANKSVSLEMQAGMIVFTELQHNTADLSGKFIKPKGELKMQTGGLMILDETGKPQAEISNGIRIFSRIATKEIMRLFKAKEIAKLGKYVLKELFAQDKREPEFTNE